MRFLAFPTSLAIILLAGAIHADLSGRWGASEGLQRAVERLDVIPHDIGSWRASDFELDPQSVQIGEIAGYVARRYENADGKRFTVMLVCGRPGPISAHTPEWCYGGSGYHTERPSVTEQLEVGDGRIASFWRNRFLKERASVPESLEICWAWNVGKGWQAPENARLAFAPERFLYKLYVVRDASADGEGGEESDARMKFMQELIPSVEAALFDERAS